MSDGVHVYNLITYSTLLTEERELMYTINTLATVFKEEEW